MSLFKNSKPRLIGSVLTENSKISPAAAGGDAAVEETEEVAPQQAESGLPEPAVDVSEALDASSGEALAESEDRVKASEAGLRAERAARKAVVENMARRGKDDASALSAKIAAAERAAARKVETSGVTLKRPGQNTDGSTLFSVVGSNQVVFIIDTSGSMGAVLPLEDGGQIRALDYVKLELAGVIRRQLSDENLFNLVPFSSDARPWRRRLVRANKDGKRSAIDYVAQFQPAGGTNLTAALYSAFNMEDVRTIYVLSDGQPSSATTTILRRVKQLNSRREIIIHTIAFCVSAGPREFLRSLALQNGGLFRAFP